MRYLYESIVVISFCVGFGWFFADRLNDYRVEQTSAQLKFGPEWRNPAAIRKTNDFSLLSGADLKKASHRRLLEDVRVVLYKEKFGIELGHFVVKDGDGEKRFACEYYDRVELRFAAQGTAVNGKIPEMKIEGQCAMSGDINRMVPLWLPLAALKSMEPRNLRSYFFENEKIFISFYDVGTAWPGSWELVGVRVFNQVKMGREIAVDSSISKKLPQHPVTISW